MNDHELIEELRVAAANTIRFVGELPPSILGIAMGFELEPDPNDPAHRNGLRITWRTYFQAQPSDDEVEFANSCSDELIDYLWRRIIWVEHENMIAPPSLVLPQKFDSWLFLRHQRAA